MAGQGLGLEEREEIRAGIEREESLSVVARRLGRSPSTVCREVARNGGRKRYRAAAAERRAAERRRRPKTPKLVAHPELADHIVTRLAGEKVSPYTIASDLAGEGAEVRVSPETIYQAVYARGGRGLPVGLHVHLHRRRRRRKHRRRDAASKKAGPLGGFRPIVSRPQAADERIEGGHWEGDLIMGAGNRSAVVTLIERTCRYCLLGDLPEGPGADGALACLIELFDRVPPELRRTLTWDQGREMSRWADLEDATGLQVYFADPHSPWQRPVNENFNGLVRRWLPKGTNLGIYSQDDLDALSRRINRMPRRSLQADTATHRYHALVVASTT